MSIVPVTPSAGEPLLAPARPKSVRRPASRRIAIRLEAVRIAIRNAQHDRELGTVLAEYGYTERRLAEGQRLYDAAVAMTQQQTLQRGEKRTAVHTLKAAYKTARTTYTQLYKLARVAFRHQPGFLTLLGLTGKRERTYATWLVQARQFYTAALDRRDVLQQLATFGVTESRLREGQAQMLLVEAATAAAMLNGGASQHTTESRNAALAELKAWYADFVAVARIAFAAQPQQLEKLGIAA